MNVKLEDKAKLESITFQLPCGGKGTIALDEIAVTSVLETPTGFHITFMFRCPSCWGIHTA